VLPTRRVKRVIYDFVIVSLGIVGIVGGLIYSYKLGHSRVYPIGVVQDLIYPDRSALQPTLRGRWVALPGQSVAVQQPLTARESEVAFLVWEGFTNRDIALRLGTTEKAVKGYLGSTLEKLGIWNRLELALYVANHGGPNWKEESKSGASTASAQKFLSSPG